MGDGRATADADDIARGLRIYRLACGVLAVIAIAGVWAVSPR
jgi:hypothetical protein